MFIKVREEAQQPVSPIGFWISVLVVVLLLGSMGLSEIQTGKVPDWNGKTDWLFLVIVWVLSLFQLVRFGRRAFPLTRIALLIASTLILSGHALPHTLVASSWVQGIGNVCLMAGILPVFLQFGGRRSKISDGEQSNSTV